MTVPASAVTLRPARRDDAALLAEWRNHPEVAAQSRNSAPIDWDDHVAWLDRVLLSADHVFFIGDSGGDACGYVRFHRAEAQDWEVSIAAAPDRRGAGFGTALLTAGIAALRREKGAGVRVIAAVRPCNAASEALFRRCGFQPAPTGADGFLRFIQPDRHGP